MAAKEDNYIVLARKYRPQSFDGLIGQEHLVKTIHNSFELEKIPHAYIFTGIRGTGKTSTARIISKAMNCIGEDGNNNKATPTPCQKCSNCIDISKGIHPDVIEMDAASKTGVDDVREIIENSNYTPARARFKIYIIDEVHMLSNNAFNALLKTLEEPPAHTKFIFATTEIKKIPLTILSRCQRFDLKKVPNEILVEFLKDICKKEAIKYEEDALQLIARLAGGSVRDSLSLLDQSRSLSNNDLKLKELRAMLGVVSKYDTSTLFEKLVRAEVTECLESIHEIFSKNVSVKQLLEDMLEINHYVTAAKVAKLDDSEFDEETLAILTKIKDEIAIPHLSRIWQMLLKGYNEVSNSFDPVKSLEMLIIRICYLEKNYDFKQLVSNSNNNNAQPTANNTAAQKDDTLKKKLS